MIDAVLAALCMVLVDVLSVVMVQAEAANRGWLAGIMDTLGWYPSIVCTTLCVLALDGHSWSAKVAVLLFVGAANLFGTKLGQIVGQEIMARTGRKSVEERVSDLEQRLGT